MAALALLLWPVWLCAAPPRVVASIGPVHSLAAAVMGDRGEPLQIVRGYGSPHAYQMRPSDAAGLRDADLVLWIGPTMETFLQRPLRSARPGTRVVALMELPGIWGKNPYRYRDTDHLVHSFAKSVLQPLEQKLAPVS